MTDLVPLAPTLDGAHHQALADRGYTVVDLLGPGDVEALLAGLDAVDARWGELDGQMATDHADAPEGRREAVAALADPVWAAHLPRVLRDQVPVLTSFAVKQPGPESAMFLHDDRTYLHDGPGRALTVWVPLCDVSPELDNGCLVVVPGSHRVASFLSGTGTTDWYRPYERWLTERATPVAVRAGQALVYDSRLLHASRHNRSGRRRPAVLCATVPRDAELVHVVADGTRQRSVHAITPDTFVHHLPSEMAEAVGRGRPVVAVVDEVVPDPAPTAVRGLVGAADGPVADAPPDVTLPPGGAPARPPAEVGDGLAGPVARVLAIAPETVAALAGATGRAPVPLDDAGSRPVARRGRWASVRLHDGARPVPLGPLDGPLADLVAAALAVPRLRGARLTVVEPGFRAELGPAARGGPDDVLVPLARAAGTAGVATAAGVEVLRLGEPTAVAAGDPFALWVDGPWPLVLLWLEVAPPPAGVRAVAADLARRHGPGARARRRRAADAAAALG